MASTGLAKAKKAAEVTLLCPGCEKEFTIRASHQRRRLKQMAQHSGRAVLYCSKKCWAISKRGGTSKQMMRRPGWSDERWLWEKKLCDLGLGVEIGTHEWLVYGSENEPSKDRKE